MKTMDEFIKVVFKYNPSDVQLLKSNKSHRIKKIIWEIHVKPLKVCRLYLPHYLEFHLPQVICTINSKVTLVCRINK